MGRGSKGRARWANRTTPPSAVFRVASWVAIIALGVEAGAPAHAMSYAYRLYGAHSIVIDAVGKIEPNERSIFVNWWYTLPLDIQNRKTLGWVFNSPGGSVIGALEIGRFIARAHANTGVAANGVCVSACVLAWANGSVKSAAPDSRIGVHNVTVSAPTPDQESAASFAANAGDALTAKYLAALGAPASVVGHLVATPPSSVYWLTPDDLAAWNVKITY